MQVTSTYLGQVLRISSRRVRQLVEEGIIERDAKTNKYHLPTCVHKYFEYKYESSTGNDADYEKERALHEKAKREKAELILARMKGRLHDAEDVEMAMTDMIVRAKTKLRGIPIKIAPSLLAQTELSIIEDITLTAIDECLTELADYSPELFTDSELFLADDEDDEEDNEEYDEHNEEE